MEIFKIHLLVIVIEKHVKICKKITKNIQICIKTLKKSNQVANIKAVTILISEMHKQRTYISILLGDLN